MTEPQKPLDPDAAKLMAQFTSAGAPPLETLDPQAARAAAAGLAKLAAPGPASVKTQDRSIDGPHGPIPLRLYRPERAAATDPLPVLVFWHGGGFVLGGIPAADSLCRHFADKLGVMVVSGGYRLAPEFRFPVQIDEALAAFRWVAAHAGAIDGDPARLAVGGESAGASLAAVVALAERDRGAKTVGAQLLLWPPVDKSSAAKAYPSYTTLGQGYFLTAPLIDYFNGLYLGDASRGADWRASPLLAEHHTGLPPALIAICGYDPLRDQNEAYATKLKHAGGVVDVMRCDTQMHAFVTMDAAIPAAGPAIAEMARRFKAIWLP